MHRSFGVKCNGMLEARVPCLVQCSRDHLSTTQSFAVDHLGTRPLGSCALNHGKLLEVLYRDLTI